MEQNYTWFEQFEIRADLISVTAACLWCQRQATMQNEYYFHY